MQEESGDRVVTSHTVEHISHGGDVEAGTWNIFENSRTDETRNTRMRMVAVIGCCFVIIICAVVLVILLGRQEESNQPTTLQSTLRPFGPNDPTSSATKIPTISPPSYAPSSFPTLPPQKTFAPTQTIPEEFIIYADADTYVPKGSKGLEAAIARGSENSFLVKNTRSNEDETAIEFSYALISFNTTELPGPQIILESSKSATLRLTHVTRSDLLRGPTNLTIVRLPGTPLLVEGINDKFWNPSGGIEEVSFPVAPMDAVLDIDVTDLLFGQATSARVIQDLQLLLMLESRVSPGTGGDRFYSSESTQGKPELTVRISRASKSPTASPTSTTQPSVRPSASSAPSASAIPSILPSENSSIWPSLDHSFSPIFPPQIDDFCSFTLESGEVITFTIGQSFGSYATNLCGSAEEFPCFCNPALSNQVECPYCGFLSSDGSLYCARDQETISYQDGDINRTCRCEIPDDEFQVPNRTCSNTAPPNVSPSVSSSPSLSATISPGPNTTVPSNPPIILPVTFRPTTESINIEI